ncbi:unnamed protein product [Prorocentrum cordatum]|uniref:Aminotransferase class I/classII large domain-containing protein n=1 Tax=Prorocentrum cordatum TaxID=2364126 RepID=A0ABN9W7V5_9DINO|nr:unnamed protein product [Polarella glacialis]
MQGDGGSSRHAGGSRVLDSSSLQWVDLRLLPLRLTIDQDAVQFILDFVQLCALPTYVEEEPHEELSEQQQVCFGFGVQLHRSDAGTAMEPPASLSRALFVLCSGRSGLPDITMQLSARQGREDRAGCAPAAAPPAHPDACKKRPLQAPDAQVTHEKAPVPLAAAEPPAKQAKVPEHEQLDGWQVVLGERAAAIRNPIREIMDTVAGQENPSKAVISLAQGDPSAYPHLRPSKHMVDAVVAAVTGGQDNGYQPSQGNARCRAAVAQAFSAKGRQPLTAADVFMSMGCSEALSHCIAALAGGPGGNMLLPRPGFPLYDVLCQYQGVEIRFYDLLPDHNWEIDVKSLDGLVDKNTRAIIINNPSNPCGAVYSRAHLTSVLAACDRLRLPVIADEVYAGMSFSEPYVQCAEVTSSVPVLSAVWAPRCHLHAAEAWR